MSNPPEFKNKRDVPQRVPSPEPSGLSFQQSIDLHKYSHEPRPTQEHMKPVDYLSKMAGDVLTHKERKEALDALYLNDDFFAKVGEEIRQEKVEKGVTRIQQALKVNVWTKSGLNRASSRL